MKILASDFDNTIFFLDDQNKTSNNIEAIRRFIENKNIFCIITGRTYREIKNDLVKINAPYSYLICGDGAMILDGNDNCLKTIKLSKKLVKQTYDLLKKNGYYPYLEDGYNIEESIEKNIENCIKVATEYFDKESAIKLSKEISEKYGVYAYASRRHININNKRCNKKEALKNLLKLAKLPKKDLYVIGDDINDYEMLSEYQGAIINRHNPILDSLNKPSYETLSDYIEELLKKNK